VLIVAKDIPTMCVFEECHDSADLVRLLGGWITGDQQAETIGLVGLSEDRVRRGEQSIIVIADRKSRIVGIYPTTRNQNGVSGNTLSLDDILQRHRNLWAATAR
jgi:hypothetical protein